MNRYVPRPLPLIVLGFAVAVVVAACTPAPPVLYELTVSTSGSGSGTIASSPEGIDTSAVDGTSAEFEDGTIVTLSAAEGAFSSFVAWGGACAGAVGTTCDVTMDAAKAVTAEFELLLGTLFFSQDGNANGLYGIDMETGVATIVGDGTTTVSGSTVGLAGRDAASDLLGSQPFGLLEIAQDGSGATETGSLGMEGLTYVNSTGILYAIINGDFFTVATDTGTEDADLADPGFDAEGLASDDDAGVIYAIGDDTNLWAYDVASDTWSSVFDLGNSWNDAGLAYSDAENVLYAVGLGTDLYRIDPIAQTSTLVGDTGLTTLEGGLGWVPAE